MPAAPINYLLPQAYDVGVTRLDKTPFGPQPGQDGQLRDGPLVTVEIPFNLQANVALQIASADPNRKQLMLQNKDVTDNLFYAMGRIADETSKFLAPGVTVLLDFNCPTDRITVFATANISGALSTVSPSG
jgi:hypothetical protein